jgi:trans-aconitate methyltransferase
MEKNEICWSNSESYTKMLEGARGILFPKLLNSDHVGILKQLISEAKPRKMLDLGCCSAEVSLLADNFEYTGADLENVINNVSKVMHPEVSYISFDAETTDFKFIKDYDTILMNAFIDVLKDGDRVFDKVLSEARSKVILHRQCIRKESELNILSSPYNGKTYQYVLSISSFKSILQKNNFKIKQQLAWANDYFSFLLERES